MDSSNGSPLSATVAMRGGRPTIHIDGTPVPPIIYGLSDIPASQSWKEQPQRNIRHFADQGIKLFQVDVCLCHCWPGPGQLDMALARKQVAGVLAVAPDAAVFIRVHVNPPHWWMKANPDEMVVYGDGPAEDEGVVERIITRDMERMMRVSLASEKWLAEAGAMFGEFCRQLAVTPEGSRVIGLQPACGAYGEWHYWGASHHPDYARPMTARFRRWLRENYGTDSRLREAWGDPAASLDAAVIPGREARLTVSDGLFHDPVADRPVIDSLKCLQAVVADDIIHFCRIAKECWPRPLITGTFYGYFVWIGPLAPVVGHLEVGRVYASPYVDYLSAPHSYYARNRDLGGAGHSRGLLESARLHGKLWLTEMDERPLGVAEHTGGAPKKHPETISMMRRNVLDPLQRGMGFWYYDHRIVPTGDLYHKMGWWDHPTLLAEVRSERELYERFFGRPYEPVADVALVYDTEVYYHLVPSGAVNVIDRDVLDNLICHTGHAGVAFDTIYLSDLERVAWSRYRTVIFANAYLLSPERRRFIRDCVARASRHLVWIYASGFSDGTRLGTDLIADATGITVVKTTPRKEMRLQGCGLPSAVCTAQGAPSPLFAVADAAAVAAGTFPESEEVSAARKTLGEATAWFFSLPPDSPDLLRALFRQSGAHIYSDANDALNAGSGLLTVHTVEGGPRRFRLRCGKVVDTVLPPCSTTVFDAASGETVLG